MNRDSEGDHYLLFRSHNWIGALALSDVREVMRPLPMENLASAPSFVIGIAIIRGTPTPVIDAAQLLQVNSKSYASTAAPNRFISLKVGSRGVCLAVDAVLDVRRLSSSHLHQTPPLLRESNAAFMPLIGALDTELLAVVNAARMVPESVWGSMQSASIPA